MENANTAVTLETKPVKTVPKNKLAFIGFLFMLTGPGVIILAEYCIIEWGLYEFKHIHEIVAHIVPWIAIILPGIGIVFSIISLVKWKKTGIAGRALAIVTVIMCNPLFYYFYIIDCINAIGILAELGLM